MKPLWAPQIDPEKLMLSFESEGASRRNKVGRERLEGKQRAVND